MFDVVLGLLGLTATLTAASDFSSHRKIRNPASGALDDKATVTQDEMLEHAFYQVEAFYYLAFRTIDMGFCGLRMDLFSGTAISECC